MAIGTTLAIMDAVARQRYMERQMMARRMGRIRLKPWEVGGEAAGMDELEWEPYDCFHLCKSCGYLSEKSDRPCPACTLGKWVDLRRITDADAIRQLERRDRKVVPESARTKGRVAAVIGGMASAGLAAGFGFAGAGTLLSATVIAPALVFGAFATGVGYFLFPRAWVSLSYRRRPTYPIRWHLPIPLPGKRTKPRATVQGPAKARGELLHAPITGRPCIGYEVSVLFDTPGDQRPPMWVLEEERTTAFEIDGQAVRPDQATLALKAQPVATEDTGADDTQITRFLRKRGLFASEGEYALFEAIITPDQPYRLEIFGDPAYAFRIRRPR